MSRSPSAAPNTSCLDNNELVRETFAAYDQLGGIESCSDLLVRKVLIQFLCFFCEEINEQFSKQVALQKFILYIFLILRAKVVTRTVVEVLV